MSDDDVDAVESVFGSGTLTDRTFTLSKGYDNTRRFSIQINQAALLKSFVSKDKLSIEDF
jgi:hypothetical protein